MNSQLVEVGVGFGKENQRMKNHANYFENPGQVNQETIAMEIKFKLKGKLLQWNEEGKSVLKAAWIGKKGRWEWTALRDGQDREGGRKSKGLEM